MNLHRLAIVLKHANSSPPAHAQMEFYALKQALLERFGARDGEDVQHIRKPCWSCTNGMFRYDYGDIEECRRCGGSGVYSERWFLLERWKLAGQTFHRPVRTLVGSLVPATIEGKIKKRESRLAQACWRVLSLLFSPQYYLYLDQFRASEKQLRQFKMVLAYLLDFPRDKWRVGGVKFAEIEAARREAIPF